MRYFIDTEFIENGPKYPVYLISIGIKCEDGREYYAENEDCPMHLANDWVKKNVVPKLHASMAKPRHEIATEILRFIMDGDEKPSFWGYFADYDWVVFAQLFGVMVDMPHGWPKFCLDLKQVWRMLGGSTVKLPQDPDEEHHALADARWNFEVWKVLNEKWRRLSSEDLP